jgi:hypothetical protein
MWIYIQKEIYGDVQEERNEDKYRRRYIEIHAGGEIWR